MQKKYINLLMVLSFSSLISCGNNNESISNSTPTTSEVESKESITISEQKSEVEENPSITVDMGSREQEVLVNIDNLYLLPNESYYLSKMLVNNLDFSIHYTSTLKDLEIDDDNGIVKAKENVTFNEDLEQVGNIYVYNDTSYQIIETHIVDSQEYGNYFMSVDIGRLYGKSILFLGDSITHNWARYTHEGDIVPGSNPNSLGYSTSYTSLLNDACHFSKAVNDAWSGGTMSYLPKSVLGRHVWKSLPGVVNDHEDDVKNAEYIYIMYGANDTCDQIEIGKMTDTMEYGQEKNASFIASMKYSIERIKEINPNAKMIFASTLVITYAYSGPYTYDDYNNAISDLATSYMIKYLDISKLFTKTNFVPTYSKDGLHPNEEGYKVLANYLLLGKVAD